MLNEKFLDFFWEIIMNRKNNTILLVMILPLVDSAFLSYLGPKIEAGRPIGRLDVKPKD
jgi:hypothetical protein